MSLAHPGTIEAGMSLREARREAWDKFVIAFADMADVELRRMLAGGQDDLLQMQGRAQALAELHRMLAQIEKHHETLQAQAQVKAQKARQR